MQFTTVLTCCYLSFLLLLVRAQSGIRDPSTARFCTLFQTYPDPSYPDLGDTCAEIAESRRITEEEFIKWNPIVGKNCENLVKGNEYCVWLDDSLAEEDDDDDDDEEEEEGEEDSSLETFILDLGALDGEDGQPLTDAKDCTKTGIGAWDCASMADLYFISEEDFIAMNPSVRQSCSNFTEDRSYCVQARTHPLLDESTVEQCTVHAPYPDLNPERAERHGSTCASFAEYWFIREENLIEWNPVLGEECEGLEEGRRYCIWVEGGGSGDGTSTGGSGIGETTTVITTSTGSRATGTSTTAEDMATSGATASTSLASSSDSPTTSASALEEEGLAAVQFDGGAMWILLLAFLGIFGCFIVL